MLLLMLVAACVARLGVSADDEAEKRLGLRAPVAVKAAMAYADGGSVGIVLVDTDSKELKIRLDKGLGSRTWGELLLGGDSEGEGSKRIEAGSKNEKAALKVLKGWLDRNWKPDEQERLGKYRSDMSAQEKHGRYVHWVVRWLESSAAERLKAKQQNWRSNVDD